MSDSERRAWLRVAIASAALAGTAVAGFSFLRWMTVPHALAQRAPDAGVAPGNGAARPPSNKVRITFLTVPVIKGKKVEVRWGKRRLGFIEWKKPLIVERPRDSGPIDVTVKLEDYITVNTRAYTFEDNKVFVKMTPVEEKHTVLGYRVQLPDAGPDGGVPDGGVPVGDARPPPIPPPGAPLPAPTAPVPAPPAPAPPAPLAP